MMKISVVIPVYNEQGSLDELTKRLISTLEGMEKPFEIIYVNDGSTDGSEEQLNRLSKADPRVISLHFRRNFGQTAAMMAGFDHASGEVVVTMDADLQNEPEDIPRLVAELEQGYDLCSGWRASRQDKALTRVWPSKVANWLISKLTGVRLHDYGCSLKAYRREVLSGIQLHGEMHRFIPIYASLNGAKVTEIRVNHNPRTTGESSYGLERIFKVGLDLIVVKFLYHYSRKPIYFFGGFAMLFLTASFLAGLFAFYLKYWAGRNLVRTPLPNLIVLTGVIGVVCILMGLLAEMIMRTYYETQNKKSYAIKDCNGLSPAGTVHPQTQETPVSDQVEKRAGDHPPNVNGAAPEAPGPPLARLASKK